MQHFLLFVLFSLKTFDTENMKAGRRRVPRDLAWGLNEAQGG